MNNNTTYIETRSIEPIPDSERHGSIFSQFTLWLGANLQAKISRSAVPLESALAHVKNSITAPGI